MKRKLRKSNIFPRDQIFRNEDYIRICYAYTSIKEESLTKDNIAEAFYAADYFQSLDLQDFIMKVVINNLKKKNDIENYLPELLSKIVDKIPSPEDNIFLNLSVEAAAIIPLNNIEFGRLSIAALRYLLKKIPL